MKQKAAKKKPAPRNAAPLKAKPTPATESESVPVKQTEKPTKPGGPHIHRWSIEGKVFCTITAWSSPAFELHEESTGERRVIRSKGSEIEKRYLFLSGQSRCWEERPKKYLEKDDNNQFIHPPEQHCKMAVEEAAQAKKGGKKFTKEDKAWAAVRSRGGAAIDRVCQLFGILHDGDSQAIAGAVAELRGLRKEPLERVFYAEVGSNLYDALGDDFALLFNPDKDQRQFAAERLKGAFCSVFDRLARLTTKMPPSISRKGKFIHDMPWEIMLIKETMRLVKERGALPTKHELKGLFKRTRPASTWTDLFDRAGLKDLPEKRPFANF